MGLKLYEFKIYFVNWNYLNEITIKGRTYKNILKFIN